MKVLILGVNGFIGNSLVRAILDRTDWRVTGMDLSRDKLEHSLEHPRFEFTCGDVSIHRDWVDRQIERSDVVIPLVAIATPMAYVKQPLEVFSLTFEENLRVARRCVDTQTRLVFPSTSEVYGMCEDEQFREDESQLVVGPIHKQRWIYACSKQLLDRVIWGYGAAGRLRFTLFRPFNWIGPRLDDPATAKEGSSRVVAQFVANLLEGQSIRLVDGGEQRRCFTYIDDGIDCLIEILKNPGGSCDSQILNIGNPDNDCSMRELAHRLRDLYVEHPLRARDRGLSEIVEVSSADFYGEGYQDIWTRKPSIVKVHDLLGWTPRVGLDEALQCTLDACLGLPSAPDLGWSAGLPADAIAAREGRLS